MLFSSVHLLLQHLLPALLMSQIWSKQYNTTSTDEECIAAYQQLPGLFFTCCALTNSGPSAVSRMHIFINQIIWHDQLMCNSAAFVALPGITLPAWHHNIVCFVIKVFKRRPESCRGVFSHVCVCVCGGGGGGREGGSERGRERKREGGRETGRRWVAAGYAPHSAALLLSYQAGPKRNVHPDVKKVHHGLACDTSVLQLLTLPDCLQAET